MYERLHSCFNEGYTKEQGKDDMCAGKREPLIVASQALHSQREKPVHVVLLGALGTTSDKLEEKV